MSCFFCRCEEHVDQNDNIDDLFFLQSVFEELKQNYQQEYQNYRLWELWVPFLRKSIL